MGDERLRSLNRAAATGDPQELAWLLWYEDNSVEPEVFSGLGAEKAARARFESARQNWTCRLFVEASHG